jgi:hypothetical protein
MKTNAKEKGKTKRWVEILTIKNTLHTTTTTCQFGNNTSNNTCNKVIWKQYLHIIDLAKSAPKQEVP